MASNKKTVNEILNWISRFPEINSRNLKAEGYMFFGSGNNLSHVTMEKKIKKVVTDHKNFKLRLTYKICKENGGQDPKVNYRNPPNQYMNLTYTESKLTIPNQSQPYRFVCNDCHLSFKNKTFSTFQNINDS